MSGRILQNREGGKCLREIIVDRGNGAKAFVLFELTKGNIAEIKDRYILEQLRSAIDSPWSTALPDGIRSALIRSVSEVVRRPLAVINPFLKPRSPRSALHHSFRLGQTPADLD